MKAAVLALRVLLATGFGFATGGAFEVWPTGAFATGPTGLGNGPGGAGLLEGGGGPGGSVALAGAGPGGGAGGPSGAFPVARGPTEPHRDGWTGGELTSTGSGTSTSIGGATGRHWFLAQIQCCPCQ